MESNLLWRVWEHPLEELIGMSEEPEGKGNAYSPTIQELEQVILTLRALGDRPGIVEDTQGSNTSNVVP